MYTLYIRPRNINWEDWKYTSFVVFVGYSQNIRRQNAMCRDKLVADVVENNGLKLRFSSWFSIHLLLHRLFIIIEWFQYINVSLLNLTFCINLYLIEKVCPAIFFLYSLRIHKRFETQLSIQCFRRRPQQVSLRPLPCDGECIDYDRWKSQTMYISNPAS